MLLQSIILCCSNDAFNFKDFIQIVFSIASIAVAYSTYYLAKKISFQKTVKDRRFEMVCQFINDFSLSYITISYRKENGNRGVSGMPLTSFQSKNFKQQHADIFESKNFIVQEDGFNNFNFMHLIGNPFLPIEISSELRKLWFHPERRIEDPMSLGQYIVILNMNNSQNKNYTIPKGNEFKDFESFYEFINSVISVTNNWLDRHEASEIKFRA